MNKRDQMAPTIKKWKHHLLMLFTILLLSVSHKGFCQPTTRNFQTTPFLLAINRPQGSLAYQYLNMIYTEVFKRLQIPFQIKYIPLKRGFIQVTSGKYDGETTRVYSYGETHPTLVRINEFLYTTDVSAFATNPLIKSLDGWTALKGLDYRVEYPRGVYISEVNLTKVVAPEKLSNITTATQGLKKLMRNRSDIYIDDELVVFPLLNTLKTFSPTKVYKVGVMQSVPLYMYIHNKNKALAPKFNLAIKKIKHEGLILKYRKIVFGF